MKQSVLRVMSVRSQAGISITPTEFAESTRTAEDAVAAIGTAVGQIVTSLVFMDDQQPILPPGFRP